jgi:SAM-dependent methyltransferase
MNNVFDAYAAYYDLLYRDKDYAGEASYVDGLIRRHHPAAKEILELGCGTGSHAFELARLGYAITGVDRSQAMVQLAQERAVQFDAPDLSFTQGDLRSFRAGRSFDAVLALFHVMSYQTSNADLAAGMVTAASHLGPDGIFIFDCWYGPGVLTDPPQQRVRKLKGDNLEIIRTARPVQYPNDNRVDVHYEIRVERPDGNKTIEEVHAMRYLFTPEVDMLLEAAGLKRIALETWANGDEPGLETWYACFVAKRQNVPNPT